MRQLIQRPLLTAAVLLQVCLVAGCGGNSSTTTTPAAAEISISPTTASVFVSQSTQLSATVSNASGSVNWSVNNVPGGNATVGMISSTGLYTAPTIPPSPNSVSVQAALASNSSVTAMAMLTITNPAPVASSLSPAAVNPASTGATLTIAGSGFAQQSTVTAGSTTLATTLVSSTELMATIPGNLVAAPGLLNVTVTTPGPGGGTSSALTLTVIASGVVSSTSNPQVAQYSLTPPQSANVMVQFGTDTTYGLNTWSQPAPSGGGAVNLLVAGMKAFTTYHMRAVATFPDGSQYVDSDHTFTTGGLDPSRVPVVTVTQPSTLTPNPGVELLDLVLGSSTTLQVGALDLQGNLVWYYDFANEPEFQPGNVVNPIKLMPDGTFLLTVSNPGLPTAPQNAFIRDIDLAGNTVWELTAAGLTQKLTAAGYNIPIDSMHHDYAALPNGHLVVLCNTVQYFSNLIGYPPNQEVVGDVLVDLDPNMNVSWVWNAFDHTDQLDLNRHLMGLPDWMHSNSLVYSPTDGNLIMSIRHQSWVIKIDYRNGSGAGDILWKLGYQGDFKLVNGTDPIDWFYAQHYATVLSPLSAHLFRLGLFDDGNLRVTDSNGDMCGAVGQIACYSTVPIFEINELAKTATVLWRDNLSPLFCFFAGDMQQFSNGNVEFDIASSFPGATFLGPYQASMVEVTQTTPPQTVYQIDVHGQDAYRALRIPSLYPGVTW